MAVYFISGIDTDSGKTIVTGLLANYIKFIKKESVITQKIAQTGCGELSEDIYIHRQLMKSELFDEDKTGVTVPYKFKFPASPHLAAALENKKINTSIINESTQKLLSKYDNVIIEGVGGLFVPLFDAYTVIDYIKDMNYPLILVSSSKLGSINHTLLSIEALQNRNIDLRGIIYNNFFSGNEIISQDTKIIISKFLEKYGYDNNIVEIPKIDNFEKSPFIDFSKLV